MRSQNLGYATQSKYATGPGLHLGTLRNVVTSNRQMRRGARTALPQFALGSKSGELVTYQTEEEFKQLCADVPEHLVKVVRGVKRLRSTGPVGRTNWLREQRRKERKHNDLRSEDSSR